MLKHIAFDVIVAILFLVGLATTFAVLATWADMPGIWQRMAVMAKHEPFSDTGPMLTVMLLSTLIPTFIHLIFAMLACSTFLRPARLWVANFLVEENGADEPLNKTIVSTYLTFCAIIAVVILWIATHGLLLFLNWTVNYFSSGTQTEFWSWLINSANYISKYISG